MAELNLLSRADARVLGARGIAPVMDDPAMDRAWDDLRVNPGGDLKPLDFQRIVLAQMLLTGEAWIWDAGGSFEPLPAPTEIRHDSDGVTPVEYRWRNYIFPTGGERGVLPADAVRWYGIRWYPGQSRGIGLARCIADGDKARGDHLRATVQREIMLAVYHLALRSNSVGLEVDATTDEATQKADDEAKVQTIDVSQSRLWEMGQEDHLDVQNSSAPPVSPLDMERFLASWMGQAYGLSRLAITGDASDANYSSARFANEMDASVWQRYRWQIILATMPVWDAWPGAANMPPPEWTAPPPIVIDPVKQAAGLRTLVEAGIVSKDWARRQLGSNPGRMQQEIDGESDGDAAGAGVRRPPPRPPNLPPQEA